MEQLVSTQWLQDELGSPDLVVLDCTVFLRMGDNGFISESGRQNWAEGHIPGAGFADLNEDLVDASSRLRYALPTAREFADAMQQLKNAQMKLSMLQVGALDSYRLAMQLADRDTPPSELNLVRYFVCYLYYLNEQYHEAAVIAAL